MPDFTVRQYGIDTSGRKILMTAHMADWWEGVVAELGFRPTIVQGAFMSRLGGGAAESAGYHDLGGCLDVRTWDLIGEQIDRMIRVTRSRGGGSWRRDESPLHGGMDSQCHITLGSDSPLSPGARASWASYLAGRNGLANNAPDYEWRPKPLVTTPPEDDMTPEQAKTLDQIAQNTERTNRMLERQRARQLAQTQRIIRRLDGLADGASAEDVRKVRADIGELAATFALDED